MLLLKRDLNLHALLESGDVLCIYKSVLILNWRCHLVADWRTLATPTVLALGYKWPVAFTHDGVIDLASTSKDAYGPFRTLRF
jgi:hypothetical protein